MHDHPSSLRSHWRPARTLGIWLLAGLAVTIATAWGLALWKEVSWERGTRTRSIRALASGEGSGWLVVEQFSGTGAVFYETNVLTGGGGSFSTASGLGGAPPAPEPVPEAMVPAWIRPTVIPWSAARGWPPTDPVNSAHVDTRGWPMLALYCTYDFQRNAGQLSARAHGALTLPGKIVPKGSWYGGGYPPSLPLRPRWTGLLVDSVFFGALVGGLHLATSAVRRARRRRRGRCVHCGYDRQGTAPEAACPECGAVPPAP